MINPTKAQQNNDLKTVSDNALNYPRAVIESGGDVKSLNILFILIDAWRYDDFNPRNTPNVYRFSQNAMVFNNHFSGGNSTQAGLFSLFYSLPSPYWESFRNSGIRPVFMNTLANQN